MTAFIEALSKADYIPKETKNKMKAAFEELNEKLKLNEELNKKIKEKKKKK
jgi:signal-transduction protein with cAMP-binding, CBS, and nucleotidyltransferase domain